MSNTERLLASVLNVFYSSLIAQKEDVLLVINDGIWIGKTVCFDNTNTTNLVEDVSENESDIRISEFVHNVRSCWEGLFEGIEEVCWSCLINFVMCVSVWLTELSNALLILTHLFLLQSFKPSIIFSSISSFHRRMASAGPSQFQLEVDQLVARIHESRQRLQNSLSRFKAANAARSRTCQSQENCQPTQQEDQPRQQEDQPTQPNVLLPTNEVHSNISEKNDCPPDRVSR